MRSSMSWEDLWPLLLDGTLDTLYMVGLAALFTAVSYTHLQVSAVATYTLHYD